MQSWADTQSSALSVSLPPPSGRPLWCRILYLEFWQAVFLLICLKTPLPYKEGVFVSLCWNWGYFTESEPKIRAIAIVTQGSARQCSFINQVQTFSFSSYLPRYGLECPASQTSIFDNSFTSDFLPVRAQSHLPERENTHVLVTHLVTVSSIAPCK